MSEEEPVSIARGAELPRVQAVECLANDAVEGRVLRNASHVQINILKIVVFEGFFAVLYLQVHYSLHKAIALSCVPVQYMHSKRTYVLVP